MIASLLRGWRYVQTPDAGRGSLPDQLAYGARASAEATGPEEVDVRPHGVA